MAIRFFSPNWHVAHFWWKVLLKIFLDGPFIQLEDHAILKPFTRDWIKLSLIWYMHGEKTEAGNSAISCSFLRIVCRYFFSRYKIEKKKRWFVSEFRTCTSCKCPSLFSYLCRKNNVVLNDLESNSGSPNWYLWPNFQHCTAVFLAPRWTWGIFKFGEKWCGFQTCFLPSWTVATWPKYILYFFTNFFVTEVECITSSVFLQYEKRVIF